MSTVDATYPFIGKNVGHKVVVTLAATIPFLLTAWAVSNFWGRGVAWPELTMLVAMMSLSGIGITLGFHRLLAHGAYKARLPVRVALMLMGTWTLQGGPASWAATHRRHHALADRPGDPHSPLDGLWHAHFSWLTRGNLVHQGPAHRQLMKDPVVRFFERFQLAGYISGFIIPGLLVLAFGGSFWTGMLWGGAVRIFLVHHITWSINSICHTWGTRPYESPDVARNNAIFGILGWGEGWHNNHHAFPKSAFLGHRWYQVDVGKYILLILRPLRLVSDLYIPSKEERRNRSARAVAATAMPAA